jgi:metallo-beta-lactamase class B
VTRFTAIIVFALALMPGAVSAQDNAKPVPPFQIFDNLYYVGLDSVSAYVLKTSAGLILIDSLYAEFADHIPKAMQQLGLNPKDLKYVIVTHAHVDHAGGAKAIQSLTGARVAMADADWEMIARGGYISSQGEKRVFPSLARDMVTKDGETLQLGDTAIKMYITPGHTAGVTSLEFPVYDQGKPYKAFVLGGMGLNTVNGVRSTQQYIDGVRRVMTMPDIQVNIQNHTPAAQLEDRRTKLASRKPGDAHPYVDAAGFQNMLRSQLASAEKKLAAEKAANRP